MWTLLVVVLSTAIGCRSNEIGSYDYDNKIEETTSGDRDNLTSNVYVLPDQIFNDGKPFFVKKDASGTIDFNAKTTPESLPVPTDEAAVASASASAAISVQSTVATAAASTANSALNSTRKHDISLDNTVRAQNIHDYLNLPVKYQSSKFVYPLMSSSYANLKYQGNNKNYISNHKFDSSTVKSVAYTTKKYRPTYSTKSYALSKHSTTESYDSSTKATPITNGTRKYSNIPPRSDHPTIRSTPNRRFSTVNRLSSTTPRPETKFPHRIRSTTTSTTTTTTTTTTTENPIQSSGHDLTAASTVASDSDESFAGTTISPNRGKNVTESEPDSMNIGDFFSYFFNNADSEETEATRPPTKATPPTTVTTLRPVASSTRVSIVTKAKDDEHIKSHNTRYNMTLGSKTRRPFNRTTASEYRSTTVRPTTTAVIDRVVSASTASPQITQYGDVAAVNTGNFRPPASMESIRVSHGAQTASFITNGQIAANTNIGNVHHHSYNEPNAVYKGQFQPPAQNDMKNIVVLPESNSASFVATSQLQTTMRFDQKTPPQTATAAASSDNNTRRPNTNLNTIDETTKPGIQFFSKGQVTSAEAYDHPNQANVVFNGPSSSNSNNVVIAPGANTASFVTTSQMSLALNQQQQQQQHQQSSSPQDQKIKSVESEINAYSGPGLQASQRPQGFQLPSTTAIPKPINSVVGSGESQTQQIRFPTESSEHAGNPPTANGNQPESASLTSTNNTIKFPSSIQPVPVSGQIAAVPSAPATEGLVKFTDVRNEITDGIDPNNYKQILQAPNANYVVFRPQSPPVAMIPQAPLVMGLTVPQLYRNPAFVFKKPTILHYPRKNYTLPNILPQFRPTQQQQQLQQQQQVLPPQIALSPEAIAANQLRQSQLHRAQYQYNVQNLRYKSPMQFLFSQRPMQIRPALDQTQNRRHFELHPGNLNRIYERPMLPHIHNRNVIGANALLIEPQRFEENMKVTVANGAAVDMDASNPDFENGDVRLAQQQQQQQQQPQPIVESQKENEAPKVEPVTTLQRLLQQKTGATNAIHHGLLSVNRNATTVQAASAAAAAAAAPDATNSQTEKPLYVVYPMQKNPIAASNRGNGEISTILAEQMQHKPASIQHHGLPYTLEKHKSRYILNSRPAYDFEKKSDNQPDPIAAENDEEDGDRPVAIAIAYSPTEPNPSHLADIYRPTPAHQAPHVPIYRPTVDNDSNNNANQQFQAPFIPSINLENTQSTHNGWSIVTPPTMLHSAKNEAKVNRISASLANTNATSLLSISRSDSGEAAEEVQASAEGTTRKFDFDNFKPEFQSGFMPIYKSAPSSSLSASSSLSVSAAASNIAPAAPIPPEKSETEKTQSDEKSTDRSDNFNLESLLYDDDDDEDDNVEENDE